MVNVLVRHKVQDFERWKGTFDSFLNMRKAGGELNYRIFHQHGNASEIVLLLDYSTLEAAKEFMASDGLKKAMAEAGVSGSPDITFLDEVRALRRTAAD